jgi:ubiquinone biosynthesis UbiH/UbiF/VisC/COQ6 family hydroxylase
MKYDIVIIGAGPAGLAFARSLANNDLDILLVEKSSLESLRDPIPDGREIALTHLSVNLLQELDAWHRIPTEFIAPIKHARVLNGESDYTLNFDNDRASVEALGFLVPNYLIRKALFEAVEPLDNVTLMTDVAVSDIHTDARGASVTLSSGEQLKASLLVAADSRFSEMRRKIGIPADMHDFSRTAIVCRMQHEKPHHNTALECFHYGRTLAVLPMNGNMSSIVITVSSDMASRILNMNAEQFNADIQMRLKNQLGNMKLIGNRYPYPLVGVHAKRFVAQRFALIGDAAVGMHPVTAHGFNLGIRGAHYLAEEIKSAQSKNRDFASPVVLEKYQANHIKITRPLYLGTNGIVGLFTSESVPAKFLRSITLRLANNFPPIKHMITNKLTEKRTSPSLFPFIFGGPN